MRFAAGEKVNFLEDARLLTPAPAFDADFPAAALYDGYADPVASFIDNTTPGPRVTIDLARLGRDGEDNGNLDLWSGGNPVGWTVTKTGTGTVAETTVGAEVRSGSAAKLGKGSGSANVAKPFRLRSGSFVNASVWTRIAAAGSAALYLYNEATKNYWNGAAWTAAVTPWATHGTTSYTEKTFSGVQLESFAACGDASLVTVQLICADVGTGGGSDFSFFDDAFLWPSWNLGAVAGHNLEPSTAPTFRKSNDNFAANDVAVGAPTLRQPSFFYYASSPVTDRWARLAFTGIQGPTSGQIWLGEIVLAYVASPTDSPEWGYSTRYLTDNVRSDFPGGKVKSSRTARQRRRVLKITLQQASAASFAQVRDEIHGRAHGSAFPVIITAPSDGKEEVFFGRVDDVLEASAVFIDINRDDIVVADNPFPRVVPVYP